MQTETGKRHLSGIFPEDDAAQMRNPIGGAMNKEAMQMFAAPIEGSLNDLVEFGETSFAGHEQTPPHQRTDAAEYYAKLIDPSGPYGRFRHAPSLPKPTGAVLNLTPWILPLSVNGRNSPRVTASGSNLIS